MKTIKMRIKTDGHSQMLDITGQVESAVRESGVQEGVCFLSVPHTTAAVTVNENADPDVIGDMDRELDKIIPWADGYRHAEGNSAAHLKSSLIGHAEQILIEDGRLVLGTWQGIYFCEYDGPRNRYIYIKVMEG